MNVAFLRLLRGDSAFWILLIAFALLLAFLLIFRRLVSLKTERETAAEGEAFLKIEPQLARPATLMRIEAAPKHSESAARAVFLPENGEEVTFALSAAQFAALPQEGTSGILYTEGGRFLRFEPMEPTSEKGGL